MRTSTATSHNIIAPIDPYDRKAGQKDLFSGVLTHIFHSIFFSRTRAQINAEIIQEQSEKRNIDRKRISAFDHK